jgi:hypothetical protein
MFADECQGKIEGSQFVGARKSAFHEVEVDWRVPLEVRK